MFADIEILEKFTAKLSKCLEDHIIAVDVFDKKNLLPVCKGINSSMRTCAFIGEKFLKCIDHLKDTGLVDSPGTVTISDRESYITIGSLNKNYLFFIKVKKNIPYGLFHVAVDRYIEEVSSAIEKSGSSK